MTMTSFSGTTTAMMILHDVYYEGFTMSRLPFLLAHPLFIYVLTAFFIFTPSSVTHTFTYL